MAFQLTISILYHIITESQLWKVPADEPTSHIERYKTGQLRSPIASFWLEVRRAAVATRKPARLWSTTDAGRQQTSLSRPDLQQHGTGYQTQLVTAEIQKQMWAPNNS